MRCLSPFLAELLLALRRAVRGPLLPALLVALGLLLVGLPGLDDPELLRTPYALGLAWALLLVSALWSGGAAYALDRERGWLTLPFVKPLHPWVLWLARFTGTLAPFAVATGAVGLLLSFRPLPEGRRCVQPLLPALDSAAEARFADFKAQGRLPAGVSKTRLLRAFREELLNRYTELAPGQALSWRFPLPAQALGEGKPGPGRTSARPSFEGDQALAKKALAPAAIRLSGAPFLGAKETLALAVQVQGNGASCTLSPSALRDHGFTVALPADFPLAGEALSVTLLRQDASEAASVLFRERVDLALLLPGVSAGVNLLLFCAILLASLAMAVALGAALGCAFSLPVTLFGSTLILLSATAATLSPGTTVADERASLFGRLSAPIAQWVSGPFKPLVRLNPIGNLFDGVMPPGEAMGALLLETVLPWILLCSLVALFTATRDEDR